MHAPSGFRALLSLRSSSLLSARPRQAKHLEAGPEVVANSALQRVVSRYVYKEEYEQSIRECMQQAPDGGKVMVAIHRQQVKNAERNEVLHRLVDSLRQEKCVGEGAKEATGAVQQASA